MISNFQFRNPVLTELKICLNEKFDDSQHNVTQTDIHFTVEIKKNEEHSNEAVVSLICEIGEKSSHAPYYIHATERAEFRWKDDMEINVDTLLRRNAPTVLLSYLRPIIAQITAATPYDAFNIPFMDFTNGLI